MFQAQTYSAGFNQMNYGITPVRMRSSRVKEFLCCKRVCYLMHRRPRGLTWLRPGLQTPQAVDRILPSPRSVRLTEWCLARHKTAPVSEEMGGLQRATSRWKHEECVCVCVVAGGVVLFNIKEELALISRCEQDAWNSGNRSHFSSDPLS